MPASFTLRKTDVSRLITELKAVDKNLFNELRREMRADIRPIANQLKANIPSKSPLSGFDRRARGVRQSIDERAPFVYRKPSVSIDVGSRSRGRRRGMYRTEPVVRLRTTDKRPSSGFSVLETAGTRSSSNRIAKGLATAGYRLGDRGRWIIPQFYNRQDELVRITRRILQTYAKQVSKRLARRF